MSNEGGLLEKARHGILSLELPACIKDSQLRYICVNKAYADFFDRPRDSFTGRTSHDLLDNPDDLEREDKERRCLVFATDEVVRCTNKNTQESYTVRCERFVDELEQTFLFEVFDTQPSPVVRQPEEARLQQEATPPCPQQQSEVGAIIQSLPVGVLLLNPDLTIEYANDCFYDLWEIPGKPDLVGQPYRRYLELGYYSGCYDVGDVTFEQMYEDRIARIRSINGRTTREVESRAGKCTLLSKTKIAGDKILITFSDSTAVRAKEREITRARAELQRVGEYMQDATGAMAQGLALVEDGRIIMSNPALARIFDVPAKLLEPGEYWTAFFKYCAARGDFGDDVEAGNTMSRWKASAANGDNLSETIQIEGGKWLNLEATISAGKYWLVIVTDVTEMKMREAELETLLARAEAADRAKSEFLANMSHEIRTPMNGVLGMAELLSKSALDTRQKTFTDVIVKSGNALLTIINDILDFSKIDAGQMTLRRSPFDPVEAIEDVASLLSSQALEKNIELLVRVEGPLDYTVSGDAGRFRQIATNLIGNAIKFTEIGHILITLSSEVVDGAEMLLTLKVEDTGIGIPKEKLDTIFEKFSQVDGSSTRRHEGTGLGLAITVGLVGLFRGKIDIDSEIGTGSTFTITLPLPIVGKRGEKSVYTPNARRPSVLIIDDNAVNRQILCEQLTSWNIDNYATDSGQSGLEILREATKLGVETDAIILDYHMPVTNGFDVARLIRADERLSSIPIILLTSLDAANDDGGGIDFAAHLMKPVRARLLRKTLDDVIRDVRLKRAGTLRFDTPQMALPNGATDFARRETDRTVTQHVKTPAAPYIETDVDILVAEDNDVNQIVFTQILQQTGFRFRIVDNGKKAVDTWRNERPSLILMDVSMPVMNGHQATQAIRRAEDDNGNCDRVPIIGVTAHALDSDRDLCLAAGMDDYISKPISPELLQEKIESWLSGRSARITANG
ncbi:response regulator [Agrobacterium larrymoorei]|uniref:response regulator n=1 Tax=Agrobacterium larrymoorei TaxID=160699 RepID=UPI00157241F8|nr:response regulator [Agrobacterium larrymoorei]NTJ43055.1 response regulator [Agrobacterium larrymoorei]